MNRRSPEEAIQTPAGNDKDKKKNGSSGIFGYFLSVQMLFGRSGRAYSHGLGESVTRGDRRRRELWFGRPSPPLASPCE
jgi:hypothetical protein